MLARDRAISAVDLVLEPGGAALNRMFLGNLKPFLADWRD
jgi:hypothetical protein